MIKKFIICGLLIIVLVTSACAVSDSMDITEEQISGDELITSPPDIFSEPTEIPLTPEQKAGLARETYRSELYSMTEEQLFLSVSGRFHCRGLAELVANQFREGIYSEEDVIEMWEMSAGKWEYADFGTDENKITIMFLDETNNYSLDFYYFSSINYSSYKANEFLGDVLLLKEEDRVIYEVYEDLPRTYVSTYWDYNAWRYSADEHGRVTSQVGFYDRIFYSFEEGNIQVDIDGFIFTSDCFDTAKEFLTSDLSDSEKLENFYTEFVLNEKLTPFEIMNLLYYGKAYYDEKLEDLSPFSDIKLSCGKTMDEIIDSIRVSTYDEVVILKEQSAQIISEARKNYPPVPEK